MCAFFNHFAKQELRQSHVTPVTKSVNKTFSRSKTLITAMFFHRGYMNWLAAKKTVGRESGAKPQK